MKTECICSVKDVTVTDGNRFILQNVQLDIERGSVTALVAGDASASSLLQAIGGFRVIDEGDITYHNSLEEGTEDLSEWVQYVPDDIICYSNMKVQEFLCGIALAASMEIVKEGVRLCKVFGIDTSEELLNLTFEQNRLVAMIQALVRKPKLLLLDRPYDLLGRKAYLLLWREILALQKTGTTVVFTAETYEDIVLPCDYYMFFREDSIYKKYRRKELPRPAKVITLEGGTMDAMNPRKLKLLYKERHRCRFLYREKDMGELVLRIYKTGCRNFNVEELSMEEEIFKDYERWMQ